VRAGDGVADAASVGGLEGNLFLVGVLLVRFQSLQSALPSWPGPPCNFCDDDDDG
jgi:hypothetical protein